MKTLKILSIALLALMLMVGMIACDNNQAPSGNGGSTHTPGKNGQTPSAPVGSNHVHEYVTSVISPTKTEDGYTLHQCKCGDSYTDEPTHATGSVGLAHKVNEDGKTCTVTGIGTATDTELYIPAYIDGYKVTILGVKAFEGNKTLTKVVLPDTITTIERRVFMDCSELTEINIPKSVTSISTQILDNCDKLTTLYYATSEIFSDFNLNDIPSIKKVIYSGYELDGLFRYNETIEEIVLLDSVKSLTYDDIYVSENRYSYYYYVGPFYGCKNLKRITLSKNIMSIVEGSFVNCKKLASIDIPNGVEKIGEDAFKGCENLTSITIPDSVTYINETAFSGCSSLISLTIPDSIRNIHLYNLSALTSISIPDSVTSLVLSDCAALASIAIPDSVTSLTLSDCTALANIAIPTSVTELNLVRCTGLMSIIIPDSVTKLSLRGCSGLTSITIPNSVTSISDYGFADCTGLTSITIPNSVTSIGMYAFNECKNLDSVAFENTTGWKHGNALGGYESVDVTNPQSNAVKLKHNAREWFCR